jgi:hypothetical protein
VEWDPQYKPRLRPVEAVPVRDANDAGGVAIALRDPSRLSQVAITLSPAALQILALMDGRQSCVQIQDRFLEDCGQPLSQHTLRQILDGLDQARMLEGPSFEAHYDRRLQEYRSRNLRPMPHAAQLGLPDGSGALFRDILRGNGLAAPSGRITGLIAPHLDYARGRPCYARAYGALRERPAPDRVVVLGTNHFGRSTSVVATACDFGTPLGVTRTDRRFLEQLERRCGDLRRFELDHLHEHSIELQVAWVQHLFGPDRFELVAFLCPDPCGPTGTSPVDGNGVDLREFADALGELISGDPADTLVVAGADLSHVGAAFGDDRTLDCGFLEEVRGIDRRALDCLAANDADAFVRTLADANNVTRVCSAGCIFTLATALSGATATVLGYHQAVDQATRTCVTCSAVAYT